MAKAAKKEQRGVLYLISGNAQDTIKLRRDATIFGREKGDIVIDDHEVSATHCQIQNISNVYHIFDMNSTNGTYVNNERIVKAKLKPDDVVTIGTTSFRFTLENENTVRHITTIFQSKTADYTRNSKIVDTLIESELRTSQPYLLVIRVTYGDGTEEEVEFEQKLLFIGRASSFGHFDQDPQISRKHLLIKLNDTGQIFIEDQGSTNGSYLNGKRIRGMHRISDKDTVRVGSCDLKISTKRG